MHAEINSRNSDKKGNRNACSVYEYLGTPATLKARDGLVNEELELRRLKLALDATVLTADAKAEGFGEVRAPRLSLMASQVSDAFATKDRVNPAAVWKDGFLPAAADRDIFKVVKK